MLKNILLVSLVSSSITLAAATTQPTASPTTRPMVKRHFPTAAELAKKIAGPTTTHADQAQVAYFDLNDKFSEAPAGFSLFGTPSTTLRELLERVEQAKGDKEIKAALFYVGAGTGLNLSQAHEVRDAIISLRQAGKKTFVYADSYDTTSYIVASGATNICLLPGGEVFIPGIGFETMFYKNALDKLGVDANYVQIGEYKGAEEPYTRSGPSPELQGELNKLVDSFYKQITDGIALNRNLKTEDVRHAIDDAIIPAKQAKADGWVDHLVDADGLRALMKEEIGREVEFKHDYGQAERKSLDVSNPFALFALLNRRPVESTKQKVAVIYAEGTIVDGDGGSGLMGGQSIGSETIRRAMRLADRDDSVKAVVIRIDSPGGSALASEAMWQAVRHVEHNKPIIISVGSMAASGGYYLASSGDWVVADPTAIVGSIGVVGGKFVMNGLYDKLGISTKTFSRGQNADLFSSTNNFDDRQKRMVTNWMKNTYDQFTERVTSTRGKKIKNIDEVARGRIFTAQDALSLGMVDQIGGLNAAIAVAAKSGKLKADDYDVTVLPPPTTFADLITARGGQANAPLLPKVELSADSILRNLPMDIRASLGQQFDLMQVLQNRPIALMTPYVLRVR